ncbi:MAG TPA: ANTAR domain-containing protein [Actinomycetota bacterium]|nr:ANTAR domain-containing protein [Actinomycetota bacterium]
MELLRVSQTEARRFRLVGRLDLSSVDRLSPVEATVAEGGDLHLDLSGLKFLDGAGLARLSALARSLNAGSGKLVVLRPPRPIERLLRRMVASHNLDNLVISRLPAVDGDSFEAPVPPRDLSRVIVTDYAPEAACLLVAELASSTVEGAHSISVSTGRTSDLVCAASTSELADEIDALQIELGEGPTIDALASGRPGGSDSLISERRWPEFSNRAMYRGIASVLSAPLPAHASTFGAITLYSTREQAFSPEAEEAVETLAAQAAVVIANSLLYWQMAELADQLKQALESRAVIDQAKGILMARDGMSADDAFATMLRTSQSGNVKVRDIAQRLVLSAQTGAHVNDLRE